MTPTAAQQLAESVVADGFDAHRAELAALLAAASHRGVNPLVVAVAADPAEPTVARLRALGRVVVEHCRLVGNGVQTPSDPPADPPAATMPAA